MKVTDKMVPPVQVSPLIKLGRYSALFLGVAYGAKRYSYLKPRAEEERRIAAEEKKKQDERKRIERELAEGTQITASYRFALRRILDTQCCFSGPHCGGRSPLSSSSTGPVGPGGVWGGEVEQRRGCGDMMTPCLW